MIATTMSQAYTLDPFTENLHHYGIVTMRNWGLESQINLLQVIDYKSQRQTPTQSIWP